jgi:hypothetical protein
VDTVNLAQAKQIAVAVNSYGEKNTDMDFPSLIKFVEKKTGEDQETISKVIEFLQVIQGATEIIPIHDPEAITMAERVKEFMDRPIDLANELQYNYGVARALLDVILTRGTNPDSEEVRKTLREIARFSDAMLKMQERVFSIQQVQAFQEQVLQILENAAPDLRNELTAILLEADL